MTIEKGKIGVEDIEFGTDTFTRTGRSGTPITVSKFNASHLPIADAGSKFTSETTEGALQECLTENGEGSGAKNYTNKSGAQRVAGDVVRIDTDTDEAFELTTTSGDTLVFGVVAETIENDASGKVITGGYVSAIKVDGACARGSYLKTSSTTTKATPIASYESGAFAIALTSVGGAGEVSAFIFGGISANYLPLTGGTMTDEFTSAGRRVGYVAKSSAYQTVDTDEFIDVAAGAGGVTITIHSAGILKAGKRWYIHNADGGAGNVTIATEGSETINGNGTLVLSNQYDVTELVSDGTNLTSIGTPYILDPINDTGEVVLTDQATITTDASLGTAFTVTLSGNRTLGAPSNPTTGQRCIWRLLQDGTGTRTITLASGAGGFRYGTDITGITLSTAANKADYIAAYYNSTADRWDVIGFIKGF